ncbi:MAG: hypothetical protein E7621_04780 [Ruminococcaceae bacterium]|nr:hypothetical protein [Oscillospiraceae bacterium]
MKKRIVSLILSVCIVFTFIPFTYADENENLAYASGALITEEQAEAYVNRAVNKMAFNLTDKIMLKFFSFDVIGTDYSAKKQMPAYVVALNFNFKEGPVEIPQIRFFVPVDGSEVWIGAEDVLDEYGKFVVYTGVDFLNYSIFEIVEKVTKTVFCVIFDALREMGQSVPELPFSIDYMNEIE